MQGDIGSGTRSGLRSPQAIIKLACHIFQLAILLTVFIWVAFFLGGLGFSPSVTDATTGANDTSKVFNWHPLLMTFAYVICMGEAVLAYRAPVANIPERQGRKLWHVTLHTIALVAGTLGIIAAIKSHTLKQPTPIPNFYSAHSALGILSSLLFLTQYGFGFSAYLWPRWHLTSRQALGPYHRHLGLSTFIIGVATMAVGIQEKTTFVQLVGKAGVRSAVIVLPAMLLPMLALYVASVGFHFVSMGPPVQSIPSSMPTIETERLYSSYSESP